jgi:hypothetical protein
MVRLSICTNAPVVILVDVRHNHGAVIIYFTARLHDGCNGVWKPPNHGRVVGGVRLRDGRQMGA